MLTCNICLWKLHSCQMVELATHHTTHIHTRLTFTQSSISQTHQSNIPMVNILACQGSRYKNLTSQVLQDDAMVSIIASIAAGWRHVNRGDLEAVKTDIVVSGLQWFSIGSLPTPTLLHTPPSICSRTHSHTEQTPTSPSQGTRKSVHKIYYYNRTWNKTLMACWQ